MDEKKLEKLKKLAIFEKEPLMGVLFQLIELNDHMAEMGKLKDIPKEVQNVRIEGVESIKGDRGDDGHTPTNNELLEIIRPLIPEVKDGKTPTKDELLKLIRPLIPQVKDGETPTDEHLSMLIMSLMPDMEAMHKEMMGSMMTEMDTSMQTKMAGMMEKEMTGEKVRKSLELLQGDKRLDKSAVKGLEDFEKDVNERFSSIPRGAPRSNNAPKFFPLTPDGSTKVFSVPKGVGGVVFGSDFPFVYTEGAGFTINGQRNQITLQTDNAPTAQSTLLYLYSSMFNT